LSYIEGAQEKSSSSEERSLEKPRGMRLALDSGGDSDEDNAQQFVRVRQPTNSLNLSQLSKKFDAIKAKRTFAYSL